MPVLPTIHVDTRAVERELARIPQAIARKVIPAAINRTTDEALRTMQRALPQRFTIRTPWVGKGFRTDKATPTKHVGRLYHRDEYLVRQEEGGTKRGRDGGKVAVPVLGAPRGSIRTKVTRPSQWPGKLKNSFAVQGKHGETLIFQRTRKKAPRPKGTRRGVVVKQPRGLANNPTVRLMYILERSVPVKPRFQMLPTVSRVVAERWGANVDGYLSLALNGRL